MNSNIALKATQSTTYTKLETYGRTETYTRTEIMGLLQTQYTIAAPLSMGINLITGKFIICMSPEYYDSLDAKLNNTTGHVSIAIKSNSPADLAVFSNNETKDVGLKGNCYVSSKFCVLGTSAFGNTLTLSTALGAGGGIRVVASTDGNEAPIVYYNRSDSRANIAGDMWVSGTNCWSRTGYHIGTPILNSYLKIFDAGTITADYRTRTPLLQADTIRGNGANQITIDDNIMITGGLGLNRSFNYKPFWVAGKVDGTNLNTAALKGRYGFSGSRPHGYLTGVYYIRFGSNPYVDAKYVVSLTNQSTGHCKIWDSILPTANGFHIVMFNTSNALSNSVFLFSVTS